MFALFSSSKKKPIRKVLPKKTEPKFWQQILFSIPFSVFSDSMDDFRQLTIREFVVSSLSKGDRGLGMDQTKQTDDWEWARANRPATGYGPDETDRSLGIGQTEQTDDWVWIRRSRPMFAYWPDRTYPNQVWTRQNRPNFGMGQTERRDRKFFQTMSLVAPNPLSANQVGLAHTCLGSPTSSWMLMWPFAL